MSPSFLLELLVVLFFGCLGLCYNSSLTILIFDTRILGEKPSVESFNKEVSVKAEII